MATLTKREGQGSPNLGHSVSMQKANPDLLSFPRKQTLIGHCHNTRAQLSVSHAT